MARHLFGVGPVQAEPGTRAEGWIPVTKRVDGSQVGIPVILVHGQEEGPTLLVDGCTHGDEVETAMAVQRICAQIDPERLRGTLIGVPVVNVLALDAMRRTTPTHWVGATDVNRVYPGRPGGTMTERLAHIYLMEVVSQAQYMINFHSGGAFCMEPPKVIYEDRGDEVGARSHNMARAFGWPILWGNPCYQGTVSHAARERGVAVIAPELGGTDRMPDRLESYVLQFADGTFNVMAHLGMLDREVRWPDRWLECTGDSHVHCSSDGLWQAELGISLETRVQKGQKLGSIRDLFGREVEAIEAPWDGVIILLRTYPMVHAGDWVLSVGEQCHYVERASLGIR